MASSRSQNTRALHKENVSIPEWDALLTSISDRLSRVLALDPGDTTGWAFFNEGRLVKSGKLSTPNGNADPLVKLLDQSKPDHVVVERYLIYPWKLKQHSFSDVATLRLIGALEFVLKGRSIHYTFQTAQQAKGFTTDEKLKTWGFWHASKHARDATRHAIYYILFGDPKTDR